MKCKTSTWSIYYPAWNAWSYSFNEIYWWRESTNWKIDTYFASSYICQNWYDFPNNPSYYINNKSLREWYTKLPIISSHGNEWILLIYKINS